MGKPTIPDINTIISMGLNPETGLPLKLGDLSCQLADDIRKQLRILDEQDAVNRYRWKLSPKIKNLTSQLLERMIYYKGEVAMFYMAANDTYYILPYALAGSINVYGQYTAITPLIFKGGQTKDKKDKDVPFVNGLIKNVVYDVTDEQYDANSVAVILKDYTPQMDEKILSRQIINDPLLGVMSEVIPMARTSMIANTGIKGMRVESEEDLAAVRLAGSAVKNAALNGNIYVPIQGRTEYQELSTGAGLRTQDYLLLLQSLNNYRQSLYGIGEGALFEKKAHTLESEQEANAVSVSAALQDGLEIRKHFAEVVNKVFGEELVSVEVNETGAQNIGENIENTDSETPYEEDNVNTYEGE